MSSGRQQIAEPKRVPANLFPEDKLYRVPEDWPVKNKRMEFAVLAARVYLGRELREKLFIDQPSEKRWIELRRIDAHDGGFEAETDELADQGGRIPFPHGI